MGKHAYQQSLEMMEEALKERDKDVTTMKVAEKARVHHLKVLCIHLAGMRVSYRGGASLSMIIKKN